MPTPLETFMGYGWTAEQSAGVIGNFWGESGLNPAAVGDGGQAYGIGQWHPDRQANFARVMGKPIQGSSVGDQLAFANWELRNTEKVAGNNLAQQNTVQGATKSFMQNFERPANMSSLGKRIAGATNAIAGKGILGAAVDAAGNVALNALGEVPILGDALGIFGIGGDSCGIICELKNWISESGFFQRLALALVAFIVLLAAFYLMKGNQVLSQVNKLGKAVA